MKLEKYYLIVFMSKNHAMVLYDVLEAEKNNAFQLIPTPCSLKAGCTYSILVPNKEYLNHINRIATEVGIYSYEIYFAYKTNGSRNYKKIKSVKK